MKFSRILKGCLFAASAAFMLCGGMMYGQGTIVPSAAGLNAPDVAAVFANGYLSELKPGVTAEQVEQIKDPFARNLAQQILNKKYDADAHTLMAEPYEPVRDLAERLRTGTYSMYENPTGLYFEEGEEVAVIVGDCGSERLIFTVHDFGRKGGHCWYNLKKGINIIKVRNQGLGYIEYYTPNYKTAKKVPVSIPSGKVNGVFVRGKSKNADWKKMLANSPTEVIDIVGKRVHLVYPVEELKKVCPNKGEELIEIYDKLIAWQQRIMGLYKYKSLPKNRMFGRVIWRGFMHADGMGAAFHNSTMNEVANPDKIPQSAWGISHEFGHVNQIRPAMKWVSTTEVTNNIFSCYANYKLNPGNMRLEHERINGGDGNVIGGRFNAYLNNALVKGQNWLQQQGPDSHPANNRPYVYDHFVKLGPLWQLELYYGIAGKGNKDFYPDVNYRAIKMDAKGKKDGELQLNFMRNACDVAKEDLSYFFRKTGMLKPIDAELDDYSCAQMTITAADCKKLTEYASKYPKPKSPVIFYISANSVNAFKNELPVKGEFNQGVTERGKNRIISHDVWKNVVVFETYAGKELVKITMVGTDSKDNSSTTVPYPDGATRIVAVAWDGKRTPVYGEMPDKK